jgi:hypothetical protein
MSSCNMNALIHECYKTFGNINMIVAMIMMNNGAKVFGGFPRDIISGKKSNDVDIILNISQTHSFDGNDFKETIGTQICQMFSEFNLSVTINETNIPPPNFNNNYFQKSTNHLTPLETVVLYNKPFEEMPYDSELLEQIINPIIALDHIEILGQINIGIWRKYKFNIDISININMKKNINPCVLENSLYLCGNVSHMLYSSASPDYIIIQMTNYIKENVKSMISLERTTEIIENLENGIITIYNLDKTKRIIRLGGLLTRGYHIKNINNKHFKMLITTLDLSVRKKKIIIDPDQQKKLTTLIKYVNL